MDWRSRDRTVDDVATCPHCGYAPRRIPVSPAHQSLSGVPVVSVPAWFFASGLVVAFPGVLVGGGAGFHGLDRYTGGVVAAVDEDRSLLVYRDDH